MNNERQKERNRAYSNIAGEYKKLFLFELQHKPLDRKLYDLFYDRVVNSGKVLEIGCGPGEISNYLWMKGLDITGIDCSEKMIAAAREGKENIDFQVGNVFALDYETGTIAGVASPYLIVNFDIEEVAEAFQEINRVLKPCGIFLVTFHIGNDENVLFENALKEGNKITFTYFKPETIKKILKESGFEITEMVIKEPYEGEKTTRAFIFAKKSSA